VLCHGVGIDTQHAPSVLIYCSDGSAQPDHTLPSPCINNQEGKAIAIDTNLTAIRMTARDLLMNAPFKE
jgi:hypothetical protein